MTSRLERIAVIIVNYGTADLVIAGVNSVRACPHGGRDISVHVVDNASPDDSADVLRAAYEAHGWQDCVTLYMETENHGFGRGNNVALHALAAQDTPPDAAFLLNPDAHIKPGAVDILARALENDPAVGFVGAAITHPDGTAMTAAFRFPSVISQFSDTLSFGPIARLCQRWTVPLPPDHPEGPVDWVSGAAVMGRFSALEELQFFDPGFFLYYEEVDLMHRAARAGWRTMYVPQAHIVHKEGEATGFADQQARAVALPAYHYQSWAHYMGKTHRRPVALAMAMARLIGALGNVTISKLRRRHNTIPQNFFSDFWGLCVKPLLKGTT